MLILRPMNWDDMNLVYSWFKNSAHSSGGLFLQEMEQDEFLCYYRSLMIDNRLKGFIIQNEAPIGITELVETNPKEAEFKFWLAEENDRGFIFPVALWIFERAFNDWGFQNIWFWVRKDNKPVLKICDKLRLQKINSFIRKVSADKDIQCFTYKFSKLEFENKIEKFLGKHTRCPICYKK